MCICRLYKLGEWQRNTNWVEGALSRRFFCIELYIHIFRLFCSQKGSILQYVNFPMYNISHCYLLKQETLLNNLTALNAVSSW